MAPAQDAIPNAPPEWPSRLVRTARGDVHLRHDPRPGKPPLMLLHGLAVHGGMYEGGMRRTLQDHVDLLVPDLRGHGATPTPGGRWEVADFADDIAALLDALDLERVDLGGYSMGGFVAQAFAQRHPDRVGRLVLMCTAPRQMRRTMRAGLGALQGIFSVVPPAAMLPISKVLLSGPGMPPEMRYVLPWLVGSNTRRGIAQSARALRRADLRPGLAALPHPVLVVTAEHDVALPRVAWQTLVDGLPSPRHVHLDDAGHGAAASHGRRIAELVLDFLSPETP